MALIIAARFATFDAANHAAQRLIETGVHEDSLHVFYVNPPGAHDTYPVGGDQALDPGTQGAPRKAWGTAALLGAIGALVGGMLTATVAESLVPIIAGAGIGAYVGSLAGAMRGMDKRRQSVQQGHTTTKPGEGRPSGVMLAVSANEDQAQNIATMLVEAGGQEVERAQGRWRAGKWEDFDPLKPPVPQSTGPVESTAP